MQSRLNPYLNFPGTARAAMEFYHRVFGGELSVTTFGEFGTTEPGLADQVMHARIESTKGFVLMASDTAPGMNHVPGTNIAICLSGDDADELRGYWERLSASGSVTTPLEKQMWGDEYGMCIDAYGIAWLVNITQPAA
ncbi:VOC family protein [Micromonospora sp. CA-249363]|uniref:VOC family protein n=1 Tax=Micromonospora sp. CA-249363 TaxID=3239963 RepID=UPI003D935B21